MRRQVRFHPVFYARLNLTGTVELRVRFLAGHLAGVEEDFAADFEAQLPAIEGHPEVRMVIGSDVDGDQLSGGQVGLDSGEVVGTAVDPGGEL